MKTYCLVCLLVTVTILAVVTDTTLALSLGVSKILRQSNGLAQRQWSRPDTDYTVNKRPCQGFPCMYTHLGSKAGRASLYKTLAGFIDECFNDASCDPGRRKRGNTGMRNDGKNFPFAAPMRRLRRSLSSKRS